MWLFMPGSNGCTIVYYLIVKKIFGYYEDKIDSYVVGAKDYANDMFHDNNLKNFKKNKISGKKYMKEDKDNINNESDNNEEKEHID